MMTLFSQLSHQRIAAGPLTAAPYALALRSGSLIGLVGLVESPDAQDCRDWGYRPQLECQLECEGTRKGKPATPTTFGAAAMQTNGFGPEVVP